MKKLLAVIVVLAITLISSVALAEVAVSGSIDTRGRAFDYNNVVDQDPGKTDYDRDTQTRVRLNFDGKAGDAKAKVTIEQDFETWGGVETANANAASQIGTSTVNGCINTVGGDIVACTGTGGTPGPGQTAVTTKTASSLKIREAWIDTGLFGPVRLKAGHLLASLGNAWFVRSMKYGSDAWIAYADIGPMHIGLVNVKIADSTMANPDQDADLYSAVVTAKLSDTMTVGANLTQLLLARPDGTADIPGVSTSGSKVVNNIGAHADLGLGPVKLKAEVDVQMGRDNTSCGETDNRDGDAGKCSEFAGNQIVVEGGLAAGPANIHFSVGRGSGNKLRTVNGASPGNAQLGTPQLGNYKSELDQDQVQVVLDADPHTSFLYEYKFGQPASSPNAPRTVLGTTNTGYANLTALSAGADVKLGAVTVGGTIWWLMATEDLVVGNGRTMNDAAISATNPSISRLESDLGIEVDVRVNWKINDAVSWNTTLGYFIPGSAYDYVVDIDPTAAILNTFQSPDEATGVQSVLSMKF